MKKENKTISLDPELLKRIQEQAEKEHRSFSSLITHIATLYLESQNA